MIMTRMAARVTAANYQVSGGLRTMVRRIFETGNIIRHSRYVSCQSILWNRKNYHVLKKKCPRNINGWRYLDILAPKVLFTDNQNDNLFQMVEDFLVIVTKTDRSDNNLLFDVVSLQHVLNVTSVRERRGRGPLINFDCDWNFQFCLRPSGKMEACDSPTGLSVSQKCFSFCPIGVSVAASVVMTSDEGSERL